MGADPEGGVEIFYTHLLLIFYGQMSSEGRC